MLASNILISFAVMVGLAAAAPHQKAGELETRQNGLRGCIGGAISCEYPKGRCAKICGDGHGFSSICSCPDGQADNPWTGAQCIDVIRAMGRYGCTT